MIGYTQRANLAYSPFGIMEGPGVSRIISLLAVLLLLYVGSYVVFRQTHTEVWERDQKAYVIFPPSFGGALYYLWRPLSYIDGAATG